MSFPRSMLVLGLFVFCVSTWSQTVSRAADPAGTSKRIPWSTSKVEGSPEPPRPWRAERVFPKLHFKNPVVVTKAPGSARWFVAEQAGKIFSFPNDPAVSQADLFIDTQELLKKEPPQSAAKSFEAVYGLTFHPKFAENRRCYICYVLRGADGNLQLAEGTRVSEFRVTDSDPPRVILESEKQLISWLQGGHNGGCLKFGPDGMLYISTGDGGPAFPPDVLNAGQDMSNLLSAILRIDVDHQDSGRPYSIPPDNPFVKLPGARGEIWSYGFRNPWKISFDRATGDLWVGDVGWELWELAIRAERGGNYGWSIVEGPQSVHVDRQVGPTPILAPALSIPHTDGVSITGGFVYRGKRFPELTGQYIFGDWETRRIWAARWDGSKLVDRQDLVDPTVRVVDFAEDEQGELYALDYDDGTLHQFVRQAETADLPKFPRALSESGLFTTASAHKLAPGVIPFSVNVEQWVDGATAERFVGIPGEGTVQVYPNKRAIPGSMFTSSMQFPRGSVLAKTLSIELERGKPDTSRRVETQLLHFDGKFWNAYSFAWNDEQTDAVLVPAEGETREFKIIDPQTPDGFVRQAWRFSSRVECVRCHNQWAEYALGFNLAQLNRGTGVHSGQASQLDELTRTKVLRLEGFASASAEPASTLSADALQKLPRLTDPFDSSADVSARARSYLHVNCAHCHRNGGGGTSYIELQHELSAEATKTLGTRPTQGTFGIPDAAVIAPRDPYRSVLFYRMAKVGAGRMPHLASEFVDQRAVRLMEQWIKQLPGNADASSSNHDTTSDLAKALMDLNRDGGSDESLRASLSELLVSTDRALWLARQIADGKVKGRVRDAAIEVGAAMNEPAVRDLFEPYLPEARRIRRLGTAIVADALLRVDGDAERGRQLWESSAVNCKSCHAVGGQGGKVGPDLSTIGKKYNKAQLLENILQPSKVIDPKFQTMLVSTSDGQVLTGVVVERNQQELVLRDVKDKELRVSADAVEQMTVLVQSLMPEQLLRDLSAAQAVDLLTYLETLRQ